MLYCQLDYPEELGTTLSGEAVTIAEDGCAETSLASMLTNVFQIIVNPPSLETLLANVDGFANNGDGDFDLIDWSAITRIYPAINLLFNEPYYNPPAGDADPANMNIIDAQLAAGYSVIIGVSFNHDSQEETPTHYVEIYKKNADGTYQMRDPMFRGDECDTVFDTRYAVNGMSVAQCILQAVSYTGPLPTTTLPETHYQIGDTISLIPGMDVPTGATPESINPSYGIISSKAPAVVTAIIVVNGQTFYNVSQKSIGGGTGYANASQVDANVYYPLPVAPTTSQNTPEAPANTEKVQVVTTDPAAIQYMTPPTAPIVPEDPLAATSIDPVVKVQQLTDEKAKVVQDLQELSDKYKIDLANYQGLVAGGYERIEDVIKDIKVVTDANTGLKKQILSVLKRNKAYHLDMAAKEQEDATAIEEGMKFEGLYKEMKADLSTLAGVFKTKPSLASILDAADRIKTAYQKVVKQLKNNQVKEAVNTAKSTEAFTVTEYENTGIGFLENLLTFKWLKGKSSQ